MFVGSAFLYQIQKDETILWSVNKEEIDIFIYLFSQGSRMSNWKKILGIYVQEKTKKI